jgi:hypothetical protein
VFRRPARPAAASPLPADLPEGGAEKWIVSVAWDDRTWGKIEALEDALAAIYQGVGS